MRATCFSFLENQLRSFNTVKPSVNEYTDYLGIQIRNRETFCLNYAADLRAFQSLLTDLRSIWARLGKERDTSRRIACWLIAILEHFGEARHFRL